AVSGQGSGTDWDGDGIPNDWEINKGLNPLESYDSLEDPDNDGKSNLEEYQLSVEYGEDFDPKTSNAPTTPVIDSPANGAIILDNQPTLVVKNAFDPGGSPVTYYFEIYSDAALKKPVDKSGEQVEGDGSTTSWQVSVGLGDNTKYFWHARAVNVDGFSSPWTSAYNFIINIENDAPSKPGISYPADGKWVKNQKPRLEVTNSTDKDGDTLTYTFEVYSNSNLTDKITEKTGVAQGAGVTSWEVDKTLTINTIYYWRAKAIDPDKLGEWSDLSSFKVDMSGEPPTIPSIQSPDDGSSTDSPDVSLFVKNSTGSGTITYYFEIDKVNTFDSPSLKKSGTVVEGSEYTSWTPGNLEYAAQYYWRIKAGNDSYESKWMVGFFSVKSLAGNLPIGKEWNLLSIPIQLEDKGVVNLFQDIKKKIKYVWSWSEEGWQVYFPYKSSAYQAEYIKNKGIKVLEELEPGRGFYVYAFSQALLNTNGKDPVNTDMVLSKGWNMAGLLISSSLSMDTLFNTLNPAKKFYVTSIWKWDRTKSKWQVYLPGLSDTALQALLVKYELDKLATLNPGDGFWILATESITLKVQ
ncbi:MAG: hypothetical protein V1751_03310, partial [Pseudomonadota bacterium]